MPQETNAGMPAGTQPEEDVWTGSPSQVINFWVFVSCILIVPIPWAIWQYIKVRCRVFRLTNQRLLITDGVFNRDTEALELYRVRDLRVSQPFWLRLFGLHNIHLVTTDTSTPEIVLEYVPASQKLADRLRQYVEACRVAKRVREIDVE